MLHKLNLRKVSLGMMSIFIVWHFIAMMVIGPFQDSKLKSSLYNIYVDYLNLIKLNGAWSFYAPNVAYGTVFRYVTISSTGEQNVHPLTESKDKFDHEYVRNINFYLYFYRDPQYTKSRKHDLSVARYLCNKHAATDVKEIIFRRYSQTKFTPEDFLQGKQPWDEEFLTRIDYGPYACASGK